jgi:hypothetical protein
MKASTVKISRNIEVEKLMEGVTFAISYLSALIPLYK